MVFVSEMLNVVSYPSKLLQYLLTTLQTTALQNEGEVKNNRTVFVKHVFHQLLVPFAPSPVKINVRPLIGQNVPKLAKIWGFLGIFSTSNH